MSKHFFVGDNELVMKHRDTTIQNHKVGLCYVTKVLESGLADHEIKTIYSTNIIQVMRLPT